MTREFTDKSLELLAELAENNDRDWYKAHKAAFESQLLGPFALTLETISAKLVDEGMDFRGGKQSMFRMNRDVRFSKDKSPYKTNVSGLLTPSGSKRQNEGFVYLHLEAQRGFAAFGRYKLDARALGPIRDRIIDEPDRFGTVLEGLAASGIDLVRTDSLKSMPRGYAEHVDHRFADELKLTHMMVLLKLPQAVWLDGTVVDLVVERALLCRDFIDFVSV